MVEQQPKKPLRSYILPKEEWSPSWKKMESVGSIRHSTSPNPHLGLTSLGRSGRHHRCLNRIHYQSGDQSKQCQTMGALILEWQGRAVPMYSKSRYTHIYGQHRNSISTILIQDTIYMRSTLGGTLTDTNDNRPYTLMAETQKVLANLLASANISPQKHNSSAGALLLKLWQIGRTPTRHLATAK